METTDLVKQLIHDIARNTLFEFNNDKTQRISYIDLSEKLDELKEDLRIVDYRIRCNEIDNTPNVVDNNEFRMTVYIWYRFDHFEWTKYDVLVKGTSVNLNDVVKEYNEIE